MNSKPHWLVLVVIIALLASIVNGCSPGAGEGDDEGGDEVEIVMVERGSLSTSVTATGSVLPRSEVRLSFELSGRVSDVLVQEGEHIVQGDKIAHLDTRDLELQVRSAQATLPPKPRSPRQRLNRK